MAKFSILMKWNVKAVCVKELIKFQKGCVDDQSEILLISDHCISWFQREMKLFITREFLKSIVHSHLNTKSLGPIIAPPHANFYNLKPALKMQE